MVGAVLPVPPPVQAVPLSVKDVGGPLVVVKLALKPIVMLPPLGMLAFHGALLEAVTCALPAGCENVTGQPFWMRSPLTNENTSDQPLIAGPVLRISRFAP